MSAQQDLKDDVYERLMARCQIDSLTGCWIFMGAWAPDDMGRIRIAGQLYTASRASAWVFKGGFQLSGPETVFRISTCDSPACFNPDHLRISDPEHRFLTKKQARLIPLQAATMSYPEIASYHGVCSTTIYNMIRNHRNCLNLENLSS